MALKAFYLYTNPPTSMSTVSSLVRVMKWKMYYFFRWKKLIVLILWQITSVDLLHKSNSSAMSYHHCCDSVVGTRLQVESNRQSLSADMNCPLSVYLADPFFQSNILLPSTPDFYILSCASLLLAVCNFSWNWTACLNGFSASCLLCGAACLNRSIPHSQHLMQWRAICLWLMLEFQLLLF